MILSLVAISIIGSTEVGPNVLEVDYLTSDSQVITITQSKDHYLSEIGEKE